MERKMMKIPKQEYTAEFKELAVKRIQEGVTPGALSKGLGVSEQTVRNWVEAAAAGRLNKPGGKVVTPEQIELSRLFDEPQGGLLGQRPDRKLVRRFQERARAWGALRDTGRDDRHNVRVHRGVLQPETAALDAGLQVADAVLERLAGFSTEEETGSMTPPVGRRKTGGRSQRLPFHFSSRIGIRYIH